MKNIDTALQRLFRSAAQVPDQTEVSVPFGFETRVVALWRANGNAGSNGIGRLVRRVATLAAAVIVIASAATFHEFREARDIVDSDSNEFAIADTAINYEFDQ